MRYSYNWIPHHNIILAQYGIGWFSQDTYFKQIFQNIFPERSLFDFHSAFQESSEYRLHAEIIPFFELASGKTEADAFYLLKNIVRRFTQFDLSLRLMMREQSLILECSHDISAFRDIKKEFCIQINEIVRQPINLEYCLMPFEMTLAKTTDTLLLKQIYKVAESYWKDALNKNITFDAVSLSYQKNDFEPFKELTRLPLKMVY